MAWKIPLADIDFDKQEEEAALRVIRSRWLSMGEEIQAFEREFAQFTGAKHALALSSATAALHLSCVAAGFTPEDEVIVPSLTFVATANAVRYTGATPIFADVTSSDDLTLSPEALERSLSPKTRGVIVMHYGGYACDMSAILEIARRKNIIVIEDSAHTVGSYLHGKHLGTHGAMGCFSFFSNKNMTTGEGGMVVTDDDALAEKLKALRSHGMTNLSWERHLGRAWSYDVTELGFNYRMDEIRAAIGRVQLGKVTGFNARRAALTEKYREYLSELAPQIQMPFAQPRGESCHHILPILLPQGADRRAFMEALKAQGIQTSIHYPPIHQFQNYMAHAEFLHGALSVTEDVCAREVTLPLYPAMQEEDVRAVAQAAQSALR